MNPEELLRELNDQANWRYSARPRPGTTIVETRRRPWILGIATVAVVATVAIALLSVFGGVVRGIRQPVAPPAATATATPGPTPTPTSTSNSTPAQTEIPAFNSSATCENLVLPSTLNDLTDREAVLTGSYPETLWSSPDQPARAFLEYGGIVCFWALGVEPAAVYAYGDLSATQRSTEEANFEERGYTRAESPFGDAWVDTYTGYGTFILGKNHWVFASNGQQGNPDSDYGVELANEVADLAPGF